MEQILISERLSCYQGCTSSGTSNFTEKKTDNGAGHTGVLKTLCYLDNRAVSYLVGGVIGS